MNEEVIFEVIVPCACGDVLDNTGDDTACPNVVFIAFPDQPLCEGWIHTETKYGRVLLTNETYVDRAGITKIRDWCNSRLALPDEE